MLFISSFIPKKYSWNPLRKTLLTTPPWDVSAEQTKVALTPLDARDAACFGVCVLPVPPLPPITITGVLFSDNVAIALSLTLLLRKLPSTAVIVTLLASSGLSSIKAAALFNPPQEVVLLPLALK